MDAAATGKQHNKPRQRAARRAPIDYRTNAVLLVLVFAAMPLQLFGWPFLLRQWGLSMLWIALPLVVLTPMHWGLIHESIHGQLSSRRGVNEWLGRALAITFLLPYDAARFGHLMHHRFTREPHDRPDVYQGAGRGVLARIGYYAHLLGGLYLAELIMPLLTLLPTAFVSRMVARQLQSDEPVAQEVQRLFVGFAGNAERRRNLRRDWIIALALHGVAFYFYGAWWPVLALTMYLRGVWLSVADNLPHYDVALDEPERARNFHVAPFWRPLLMNHHLHRVHHQFPTLPWTALPAIAQETPDEPRAAYFRCALRQFQGFGRLD